MKYWVLYTSKSTVPISAVISPTNLLALIRITQQDNLQAESEGFAIKGATSEMTLSFLLLSLYLLSFYVTRAWSRKEYATIMTLKKFEYDAQAPLAIVVLFRQTLACT